ncbi:hypothetical protein PsYK624_104210 [Phanerochaete sordida]|uniref:Survival Motor Neuron Gemin2-binding domain-containing protein n=1 Tax=Phanerochaete sordida TaxID=48140 RepID=A0A9P3GEK6_9APHY|nr:hypothetical protein PsYK624_104210 [Phanerochaete sordida]
MNYGSDAAGAPENGEYAEEEEEESRDLTHEEIWDDSALIDAWNSATAEYEAYHGKGKSWKDEPVKKSPLWYNVPPSPSQLANGKGKAKQTNGATAAPANDGSDSKPLDFNTFVPSHDPSLAANGGAEQAEAHAAEYPQSYLPASSGAVVGQDEAFEKALNAMYWSGYWTAVYHYHRQQQSPGGPAQADEEAEEEGEEAGEGDAAMDDLIDTQR